MSLLVAVGALQFSAGSIVVEAAFVALRQVSNVLLHRSSSGRCYRGMNRRNLLLLPNFLLFLVIPELLLVVSGFGRFRNG